MFEYFKKVLMQQKIRKDKQRQKQAQQAPERKEPAPLSESLEINLVQIKRLLGNSTDVVIKPFVLGEPDALRGALVLVDGLVDQNSVNLSILKPLMYDAEIETAEEQGERMSLQRLNERFLSTSEVKQVESLDEVLGEVLSANTVLLLDGEKAALSLSLRRWEKRGVEEPQTESVVRGPREGFTESLRDNTAMIRRKLKTPNLRVESMKVGRQTQTDVCLIYIEGIVKEGLVEEVKRRLNEIDVDSILDSGYIEAYIQDAPYSIFQTVGNSERPDTVAGRLLEGRAAIVVDGSPFVLTVPMVFIENFQAAEDYYIRPHFATALRFIRLVCFFLALLSPAVYVALTTFHQELIPTKLLFTMTAGLAGVPFPALVEALIMVFMFDILKEAGIRLPKPVGSAISIVGALVIGQSAVEAGIIGPFMIIVVSITAIASFVVPAQADAIALIRYFFLFVAGLLGGPGIVLGMLGVGIYLVSLKSFGVDYLSPITPFYRESMKDSFVRAPLWQMILRPAMLSGPNRKRRGSPDTYWQRGKS